MFKICIVVLYYSIYLRIVSIYNKKESIRETIQFNLNIFTFILATNKDDSSNRSNTFIDKMNLN